MMAGMQTETRAEMGRLANAQAAASTKAKIAEEALSGLRHTDEGPRPLVQAG